MRSKGTETRRLTTGWSLFQLASICADDGVPRCGVLCRWHGKDVLPAPVISIKCILFFSDKAPTPCSSNAAASTSMDASVDEMPVLVDHDARATIGKRFGSLLLSTAGKGAAGSGGFDYDLVIIGHRRRPARSRQGPADYVLDYFPLRSQ
ncbi:uncharacterized protein [Miscanthus floridulus]|uniref:uncharacterized protein n=1 Tax=Miscanthus floridulus TaxID=154761 RepID=UPI003459CA25